jgi:SAM-dependent methyltransferase
MSIGHERREQLIDYARRVSERLNRAAAMVLCRGDQVECNLCAWRGSRFIDDPWHRATRCPRCGNGIRQRLLMAALDLPEYRGLIDQKTVVHFAPEPILRDRLSRVAKRYLSADLFDGRAELNLDIEEMQGFSAGTVDVLVACDVLEHVSDDRRALAEIYRVLRPGGTAVLTIPQKDYAAVTYEDKFITDPVGRKIAFGQVDHVRLYGMDVLERMTAAGFTVDVVDEGRFSDDIVVRNVLRPPVLSTKPLATNFRKVYFCAKPVP